MLDEMNRDEPTPRVGRGCSIGNDRIWLEGHSDESDMPLLHTGNDFHLKRQFDKRRSLLCHHLKHWKDRMNV